jgi:hypothetical protein
MTNYFNAKQSKVDIWELRLSVDKVIFILRREKELYLK